MSQATYKNNREHAIALMEAGGATKEALIAELGCTAKSLASLFVQLRLMGKFPIKHGDGTYSVGTLEEYEASKPAPKEKKETTPKTPEQMLTAAQNRETRAATAATNAKKRYEQDPSRKNELRLTIADAELELASILLGEAEENMRNCEGAIGAAENAPDGEDAGVDSIL